MRPRKTILCVEGNEQSLSVRKFTLETRGYRVVALTSGLDALEHLESVLPGSVDLLLAEVVLPGLDGGDLVRRARQLHPGLPTLLISATASHYEQAAVADAVLPRGAAGASEMLDRIRLLMARKRGPKRPRVPAHALPAMG